MSKTVEILEEAAEVVEDTLDTLERIPTANLNGTTKAQQILILTFTAAVAAAAGAAITYKVMDIRLKTKYEKIAEQEIADARAFFAGTKSGVFSDPVSAAQALIPDEDREEPASVEDAAEAVNEYSTGVLPQSEKDRLLTQASLGTPYHEMYKGDADKPDITLENADAIIEGNPDADPQEVMGRIKFPTTPAEADNFDYDAEVALRDGETPYVITHDEFYQNDRGFEQQSLTWFEGDSVLCDSQDETIDDVESMVANKNMDRFGHGSKDENIVYIRNERFELDFEVALSHGTYTKDILGLDPVE